MPLNPSLKQELKEEIISKLKRKMEKYDFSKKSGNPFVDIIFGKYSNLKSFIHGTATMLGSEYEIMAKKIAQSNPNFIKAEKRALIGKISDNEKAVITDLVKDLEESSKGSNYNYEIKSIFAADSENLKDTKIMIDLYLQDKQGKEFFVEMKGPDPNKKEVRAAKADLLNVVAIKKRTVNLTKFNKQIEVIFGVYYNNKEGEYKNWKVSPLFEKNKGVRVQEEFWNFLGGKDTFKDLLEMINEIKEEVYPLIKQKINMLT